MQAIFSACFLLLFPAWQRPIKKEIATFFDRLAPEWDARMVTDGGKKTLEKRFKGLLRYQWLSFLADVIGLRRS